MDSRGRKAMPRDVQVSKAMSKLLRHQLDNSKIERLPGGYINVKHMLDYTTIKSLKVTFEEVKSIVADNDKQRFAMVALEESQDPQDHIIRANQGHSVKVDNEDLLTPIIIDNAPATVVHGTTRAAWPLIVESGGLKKMKRMHIHFAPGLPSEGTVISGMRSSSTILVYIDITKALEAGLKFWTSENGVILSEGDNSGLISMEYFQKVEDRLNGLLLVDGKIIQG